MEKNSIPIEINLVSNEFILKVKDRHPFSLYKEFGVPISTDDDDANFAYQYD
jgi:adenosine deaminase/adenosine deaminase CECR1